MIKIEKYKKLNEIFDLILEYGKTTDGMTKIQNLKRSELKELIEVYYKYGELTWEYVLDKNVINNKNEYEYIISNFNWACDNARVHLENVNDPRSIWYQKE